MLSGLYNALVFDWRNGVTPLETSALSSVCVLSSTVRKKSWFMAVGLGAGGAYRGMTVQQLLALVTDHLIEA